MPFRRVYRCAVIEEGRPCPSGFEAFFSRRGYQEYSSSRWICNDHLARGYAWLSQITADPYVQIEDVIPEGLGARNWELKTRPDKGFPFLYHQQTSSAKGKDSLVGWGIVQEFPDDTLMLRLEEARDPQGRIVQRRVKKVVGFAAPPDSKRPFDGKLDNF